jgi:Flp pilus assembly protein TadD
MTASVSETEVRALQRRAEQAIRSAKPRDFIVRILEQLVASAAADSDAARFAHRHLAELRLEESPWRAALHLRRVLALDGDDDVAHALMGLCQALQANFRCAVGSYRRAVALAPANPWYNHNLGHLLDVAIGGSRDALPYLRRAHKLEPTQDEVTASLAHCLGRLGECDEALTLARSLVKRSPRDPHHRTLLTWLERGAPVSSDSTVPGLLSAISPAAAAARPSEAGGASDGLSDREGVTWTAVEGLLSEVMGSSQRASGELDRARVLWRDYVRVASPILGRPAVLAAAVEYALARVDGLDVKQKDVAARHGVSLSSLQTRYSTLRSLLQLRPRDPRYARVARDREDPGR